MNFEIVPYVGAGVLKCGMTSLQIQNALSTEPEKFKKSKDDEYDTDAFECCHVYYRSPGICEAIEFFGEARVTFAGKTMLGKLYSEVKAMFESMDDSIDYDDAGFTSFKYGVGIYVPSANDPDDRVESVIVFEKGYYD